MNKEEHSKDKRLADIFTKLSANESFSKEEQKEIDKYIKKQGLHYNKGAEDIANVIGANQKWLGGQYVESIRTLAITAGALASFSIFLLSSGVIEEKVSLLLLVLGSILLLLVVILSFAHLFNRLSVETIGLQNLREKSLTPMQARASDTVRCLMGKLTRYEWLQKEQDFLGKYEEISQSLDNSKRKKLSHFDEFALGIFILAVSLIIMSLALKGLVPNYY